jgi:hypothetical protein
LNLLNRLIKHERGEIAATEIDVKKCEEEGIQEQTGWVSAAVKRTPSVAQ